MRGDDHYLPHRRMQRRRDNAMLNHALSDKPGMEDLTHCGLFKVDPVYGDIAVGPHQEVTCEECRKGMALRSIAVLSEGADR